MPYVDKITQNGIDYDIYSRPVADAIAEEFSTSKSYSAGDYVFYETVLYRFKVDHAAGNWVSSQVETIKVGNEITDLKEDLDEAIDELKDNVYGINNTIFDSIGLLELNNYDLKKGSVQECLFRFNIRKDKPVTFNFLLSSAVSHPIYYYIQDENGNNLLPGSSRAIPSGTLNVTYTYTSLIDYPNATLKMSLTGNATSNAVFKYIKVFDYNGKIDERIDFLENTNEQLYYTAKETSKLVGVIGGQNIHIKPGTEKRSILAFDVLANTIITVTIKRSSTLNVNNYIYLSDKDGNDLLGNSRSFPAGNTELTFSFSLNEEYNDVQLQYSSASSADSDVIITEVKATWESVYAKKNIVGTTFGCLIPSPYDKGYPQIDTENNTFSIPGGSVLLDKRLNNGSYYYINTKVSVDFTSISGRVVIYWDAQSNGLIAKTYTNSGSPVPDYYILLLTYNRTTKAVSSAIPVMIDGLFYGITFSSSDGQPIEIENEYNATREHNESVFSADRVSYLFVTDIHVDYFPQQIDYFRNQLKIISDMANSSDVDFVVLGGDYIDGTGTKSTATKYLRFITDAIKNCQKPILVCRGNHDKNNNGSQESSEYVTTKDFYTIMQAPFRRSDFVYDDAASDVELYFYYDVPNKKTRVILYDSIFNDHPSEMIQWLCEEALTKKEAGWKYIIATHVPFNNQYNTGGMTWVGQYGAQIEGIVLALNNRTSYNGTAGSYTINLDFSDYLSKVVVISTGHQHTDLVRWDPNTNCFFTTTGCATPSGGQGTFNDSTMQSDGEQTSGRNSMDKDNPNKYLFDLFSVTNTSITRSRFGNGVDKTVSNV